MHACILVMAAPRKPYLLRDAGLLVGVMEVLYLGVQWGVAHLWDSWKISRRRTWVLQGQDCLSSHTYKKTPFFLQCIGYNSQHCKEDCHEDCEAYKYGQFMDTWYSRLFRVSSLGHHSHSLIS